MLQEDSDDATAWYELARTKHHMGLGNPRELMNNLGDLETTINEAASKDPENLSYAYYNAQLTMFCAYASLMRQQPDAREKVQKVIEAYEAVLELNPECVEALLDLTEILGLLDTDMGGDLARAKAYAGQLVEIDPVYAAKARQFLLEKDADRIEYWEEVLDAHPDNADVLEELGTACMMEGETEKAVGYTEMAMEKDPGKTLLLLNLARYHIMSAMRNKEDMDTLLPVGEKYLTAYIESGPVPPLKAYALGISGRVKWMQEDKEGSANIREQANTLDPFYSKATGVPSMALFAKPGDPGLHHSYWTRPF